MSSRTLIPLSAINIFDNESLTLFYQVRECLSAYSNCWGVTDRRDVGLQIVEVLEAFLAHNISDEEANHLDKLLAALKRSQSSTSHKADPKKTTKEYLEDILNPAQANVVPSERLAKKSSRGILATLKVLSPEGVRLLKISGDIDLNGLKQLYKKAAKIHHPDVGGSVSDMQIVNDAYSLFHDAILNYRPIESDRPGTFYASNLAELQFSIRITLASIFGDSYAADHAFSQIKLASLLMEKPTEESVGEFLNSIRDFSRVISNPARALGRVGMRKHLNELDLNPFN